ncbi:MAG TPA: GNAT family N-acetyltransferase, partial [Gemmataceae bacterium]|nr:GNAT family N-acetyltransferase [Gemmataceae bacterium]
MTIQQEQVRGLQPTVPVILSDTARSSGLRVRVLRDFTELRQLAPAWQALLERSSANEPMLSPTWLLEWWRVYGQRCQLAVGAIYDGAQLVGLAPLLWRRFWYRPGIPFRRLEFLGADVDEQDGVCSDYLSIIAERGHEERVANALVAAITRREFGLWDEVSLAALAGDNPMTDLLEAAFREAGFLVSRQTSTLSPYIALPSSWDDYLKALPKKHRYGVLRSQRDMDDWAAGGAVFHYASSPAELVKGQSILAALHAERWQAAGQGGAFSGQRFASFHNAVMPQLHAQHALELMWLTVRGVPVAAMYNIVWNNKTYFYQSGRKMDLPRHLRPGIVVIAYGIQRAIAAGRREFDFLADNTQYKKQLTITTRPVLRLRVARRTPLECGQRVADQALCGLRWL